MAETAKTYTIPLKGDTTANWVASNRMLVSNEVGIERTTDGRIKLKVGDGTTPWNSLGYALPSPECVIETDENEITISLNDERNPEYRCGDLRWITVSDVDTTKNTYVISLSFTAIIREEDGEPTGLSLPDNSLCSGTDCIDNVFTPIENTRYNIMLWYDGEYIICQILGIRIPQKEATPEVSNGETVEENPEQNPIEEIPVEDDPEGTDNTDGGNEYE